MAAGRRFERTNPSDINKTRPHILRTITSSIWRRIRMGIVGWGAAGFRMFRPRLASKRRCELICGLEFLQKGAAEASTGNLPGSIAEGSAPPNVGQLAMRVHATARVSQRGAGLATRLLQIGQHPTSCVGLAG
jgi:hypothetical protein